MLASSHHPRSSSPRQIQMYYPQLASFTLITIFISFYIPTSHSQIPYNCTDTYSCGQNLHQIGYPFSGQNRHSACGLPGFQLTCRDGDITTIETGSQIYRVLQINGNGSTITLARNNQTVCPQPLNETLFGYSSDDVRFINLFYSCPASFEIVGLDTVTCQINGNIRKGFYVNESLASTESNLCRLSEGVPVNRTFFQEFEEGEGRISLEELIGSGVRVEYKYDVEACSECENSGGVCWSGTNTSARSCLCPVDGIIRVGVCSSASYPNYARFSPPPDRVYARFSPAMAVYFGEVALVSIASLTTCFIIYLCRRKSSLRESLAFWKSRTKNDKLIEAFITQCGFSAPKRYKFYEIKRMTNSFKDELGRGGFGTVFKGVLQDGSLVAVKVLKKSKENGEEFINEVASIGKTSHVNIVSLLGFCYEGKQRALVYEFMPNGSLEKFLNHIIPTESVQILGVVKLYEIALGIAQGLEYLHRGCTTRILHFDIKPHNILLDKDFCPKISDFGLAKIHSREESIVSMHEEARGTIGYIAPEVFNRNFGGVSHKSDVYSYGMMVLEMVCGRKNINARDNHSSDIYFPQWIYKQLEPDEDLGTDILENEIARKMKIVGLWCIQTSPSQRPSIKKVIEMLEGNMEALEIPANTFYSSPPHLHETSSTTRESPSLQ